MSYIYNNLGKDYSEEYKEFSKEILAKNEQIIKKAGIKPPIFNNDLESDNSSLNSENIKTNEDENKIKSVKKDNKTKYDKSFISKNMTLNNVKFSTGMMNTIYKNSRKAFNIMSNNQSETDTSIDEFTHTLEESDGTDDNDDMANFLSREYDKGFSINGEVDIYYEKDNDTINKTVTKSVSGNATGSYRSKNEKFTISYAGSFEYTNNQVTTDDNVQTETSSTKNNDKSGNVVFMAKYKAKNCTYASGGIANIYDNNSEQYNIYAGIMHNNTGIAATVRRNIFVTHDQGEKITTNKTDVKLHLLKPKPAEKQSGHIADARLPESTQEYESLVREDQQEVEAIAEQGEYGFGLNLKLSSSQDADEYGVQMKYASLITKKTDEKKKIILTPYMELADYHPNTNEGIKVRAGVMGTLDCKTNNNLKISAKAIVDNKRIIQPGSHPKNTFMAVLDTTVSKKRVSANVSTGYINSNSQVKYSFIIGKVQYIMKHSSVSFGLGKQKYKYGDSENNVLHADLQYAVEF